MIDFIIVMLAMSTAVFFFLAGMHWEKSVDGQFVGWVIMGIAASLALINAVSIAERIP